MRTDPSKTRKRVCYYKWEFLRRNSEYQRDYKEFLVVCQQQGWDPKDELIRCEAFEKEPDKQIRIKYGIALLEDPNKHISLAKIEDNPFWRLIEDRGLKRPTWPSIQNPLYPKGEPVIRTYGGSFEDKVQAPLNLIIDLTYPKSEILARVKKLVDDAIKERRKLGLPVHSSRKQFKLYGVYLKIWDLKKQGLTYKEIAAKIYPNEPLDYELEPAFDDEKYGKRIEELITKGKTEREAYAIADKEFGTGGKRNPTIQRVIDQYREAERLVNGGYLEIR